MVDGLLGLMPVGCRNATYISADAMETLGKAGIADKDIFGMAGVMTWSHGPYLDDWSKVTHTPTFSAHPRFCAQALALS